MGCSASDQKEEQVDPGLEPPGNDSVCPFTGGTNSLREAERALLEHGRVLLGACQCQYEVTDVQIGNGHHIHTLKFSPPDLDPAADPLVLVHGFGSGVGLWYATLPLMRRLGRTVYAIDSMGCGLSSRPKWRHGDGADCPVPEAEHFFISAMDAWRAAVGLDRLILIGHSMGGYLSTAYTERYADRVARLVLVGVAGIPVPPEPREPDPSASKPPLRMRVAICLWEQGYSPFNVVRYGPGRAIMQRYVDGFQSSPWLTQDKLQEYLYRNWSGGNASGGGYLHSTLLSPRIGGDRPAVYARSPLHPRILKMSVPVGFVFGVTDWMDYRDAEVLREAQPLERKSPVVRVDKAGHNVMIDNPHGLVEAIELVLQGKGNGSTVGNYPSAVIDATLHR